MKLSFVSSLLSSMYTDKLTVRRFSKVTKEDGTTGMSKTPIDVYTDVQCRISFESQDSSLGNREDTNPKNVRVKIFCSNAIEVTKGDTLVASRMADNGSVLATYKGLAGLPSIFTSHQEFLLNEVGDA